MSFPCAAICYDSPGTTTAVLNHFQITAVKSVMNMNNKMYCNEIFKLTECIINVINAN